MNTQDLKNRRRIRRKMHIRKRIKGSEDRPRMTVYKSLNEIYVQIINDEDGVTIVSASSIGKEFKKNSKDGMKKLEKSKLVGGLIAKLAVEKDIKQVAFDRNGYLYHGRVKALADAAREGGLKF